MMSYTELFVGTLLLLLGIVVLVTAAITGYYSHGGGKLRAGALATLGIVALAVLPFALGWPSIGSFLSELLWPLLIMGSAAAAGLGATLGLLYILAEGR